MTDPILLDLKGLKCPLPVLKTRKALSKLAPGTTITVLTTDPMAAIDIPHFCTEDGHQLISSRMEGEACHFVLQKGA